MVRTAVINRLRLPANTARLTALVAEMQSNAGEILIRAGKAKLQDQFPVIVVETVDGDDPWGATNYTRDVRVNLRIVGMVKLPTVRSRDDRLTVYAEEYLVKLGDMIKTMFNEPHLQQFDNVDGNGGGIYDSKAGMMTFPEYKDGIRAVSIQWFGKLWVISKPPQPPLP